MSPALRCFSRYRVPGDTHTLMQCHVYTSSVTTLGLKHAPRIGPSRPRPPQPCSDRSGIGIEVVRDHLTSTCSHPLNEHTFSLSLLYKMPYGRLRLECVLQIQRIEVMRSKLGYSRSPGANKQRRRQPHRRYLQTCQSCAIRTNFRDCR